MAASLYLIKTRLHYRMAAEYFMDFLFIFNGLWFEVMELERKGPLKGSSSIYQLDCFIRFVLF